jgi:uncharacterized SAM-binding protein YcdF (DUF218 family)
MIRRIGFIIIGLLFVISLLYLNGSNILTAYANLFRMNNATKGADAIISLAGSPGTRVPKVIDLYKSGYAKNIYITSVKKKESRYPDLFKGQTWITKEILSRENISVRLIPSLKDGATSTFDEAHDIAAFIKQGVPLKHIILVTDAFHTARAFYAFKKIFSLYKLDVRLEIAAAENSIYNETNWWKHEKGVTQYFLEPLKLIVYLFNDKNASFLKSES